MNLESDAHDDELFRQDRDDESQSSSANLEGPTQKRAIMDQVPRLVDDKRKYLERRLSAAQMHQNLFYQQSHILQRQLVGCLSMSHIPSWKRGDRVCRTTF